MSTIPETISLLEQYNKWRRGDDTITMPDPFEVGVAIGDAVRLLNELEHIKSEFEKIALLCARKADSNVELRLRAEKAEAKLHALTLICGTNDANKFQSWVDREREKVRVLRDALKVLVENGGIGPESMFHNARETLVITWEASK
jgi:hypothetical protein